MFLFTRGPRLISVLSLAQWRGRMVMSGGAAQRGMPSYVEMKQTLTRYREVVSRVLRVFKFLAHKGFSLRPSLPTGVTLAPLQPYNGPSERRNRRSTLATEATI